MGRGQKADSNVLYGAAPRNTKSSPKLLVKPPWLSQYCQQISQELGITSEDDELTVLLENIPYEADLDRLKQRLVCRRLREQLIPLSKGALEKPAGARILKTNQDHLSWNSYVTRGEDIVIAIEGLAEATAGPEDQAAQVIDEAERILLDIRDEKVGTQNPLFKQQLLKDERILEVALDTFDARFVNSQSLPPVLSGLSKLSTFSETKQQLWQEEYQRAVDEISQL